MQKAESRMKCFTPWCKVGFTIVYILLHHVTLTKPKTQLLVPLSNTYLCDVWLLSCHCMKPKY